MNIPELDYIDIVPKSKGNIPMGKLAVPADRITGVHAQNLIASGQLKVSDFVRRKPIWLITLRETDEVQVASNDQPIASSDDSGQKYWTVGEQKFEVAKHQLHAHTEVAVSLIFKDFNKPNAEMIMPEMVLNNTVATPLPLQVNPAPVVTQAAQAAQPKSALPSLFNMSAPDMFEDTEQLEEGFGGRASALRYVSTCLGAAPDADTEFLLSELQKLYDTKHCKHTTDRLLKFLACFETVRPGQPDINALVIGLNDGQNAMALQIASNQNRINLVSVLALQKSQAKGESTRKACWMEAALAEAGDFNGDLAHTVDDQYMLRALFPLESDPDQSYMTVVHRAPSAADYADLVPQRNCNFVLFDHVEANPDLVSSIISKLVPVTDTQTIWVINHWNMPAVRLAFEQIFAEGKAGKTTLQVQWQLVLPGYLDADEGYDQDGYGNGVCVAFLTQYEEE